MLLEKKTFLEYMKLVFSFFKALIQSYTPILKQFLFNKFPRKFQFETPIFSIVKTFFFQKSTSVVADGLEEKLKKLEQTRDYLTTSAGTDNVDISNRSAVNIG